MAVFYLESKMKKYSKEEAIQAFWNKVDKRGEDDCWEWKGSINHSGYGQLTFDKKHIFAHRLSYIFENGDIPEGMCICHHCDNPGCVNPKHLFIGTVRDNVLDMISKNRKYSNVGENNGRSKLTTDQVIEIRRKYKRRIYTQLMLAKEYGVARPSIKDILVGSHWKHLL
jgi:hypothetical protein